MRVGVVGSRDFVDLDKVNLRLQELHKAGELDSVVSGGAPGVDQRAESVALKHLAVPVLSFRPRAVGKVLKWGESYCVDRWVLVPGEKGTHITLGERYPTFAAAAFVRNSYIVEAADAVIAFHHRDSRGTADSIAKARELGNLLEVIRG